MESTTELRIEPRFNTDSAATIETLRGKVQTWEGRIADVSGTGSRLMLSEPLDLGETIRLTACGSQILARVRYCVRAGGSFVVGVERVDEWVAAGSDIPSEPTTRPRLRNPVGSLRAAVLNEMFADPRLRMKQAKSRAPLIVAAGAVVVASLVIWFRWY